MRIATNRFLRVAVASTEEPVTDAAPEAAPAVAADAEPRQQRRAGGRRQNPASKLGPERTLTLDDLAAGNSYDGVVVSITDFGAFVNIGCATDGLLHISQISTGFVRNVADAVSVGQAIPVRVLNVDHDRKKFSLTAIPEGEAPPPRGERSERGPREDGGSQSGERPRQARAQKERRTREPIPVVAGDVFTGKINSVAPFGVFVEVGNGHSGMLHSSQMKLPEGVEDHLKHYKEGDEVEVRVASVTTGRQSKISLTQKSEEEMAAEERTRTRGLSATGEQPDLRMPSS